MRKMWTCEGNTWRSAALTVKDNTWRVVSAGFSRDHVKAAGCITIWMVHAGWLTHISKHQLPQYVHDQLTEKLTYSKSLYSFRFKSSDSKLSLFRQTAGFIKHGRELWELYNKQDERWTDLTLWRDLKLENANKAIGSRTIKKKAGSGFHSTQ